MPRIACVLVPNFAVAAACRAEPELAGRPLVLAEGRGPHARVVAVSAAARARGIRPGCTATQAGTAAAHLVAGEAGLATALVARAARVGLAARAGVGASMTVARLAARYGDGAQVVPAGTERGFLAPLPLASLAPPPDIAATLARWGVTRLGDLARLPAAEVATRL